MASNRMESEEDFWTKSQTKGFSFNEDVDIDDESNPWMKDLPDATKIKNELREDIVSVYSGISEASSEDHPINSQLNEFPDFLWQNTEQEPETTFLEGLPRIPGLKQSFSDKSEEHRGIGGTTINGVIYGLLNGLEVNLENIRSLAKKKSLLAKAIELQDGNSILTVVLFLQRTLRDSLFQQILMENRIAADHYIRYLERKSDTARLVDVLNMLGRTREAIIVRYKLILRSEGNLTKIEHQLKHFYTAECNITDEYIAQIVKSHFELIDLHKKIKEKRPEFETKEYPSILKTLGFLSQEFYEDIALPFSPVCFRATYQLNDKQFGWVTLLALTKAQKWPQIESLLLTKSWLGLVSAKDKCLLPLEGVCYALKGAPVDLISRFLRLIDDTDKKVAIAKKLKCHMVVLEVYAQQKDRVAIMTYRTCLDKGSKEDLCAETLVVKSAIKWKN